MSRRALGVLVAVGIASSISVWVRAQSGTSAIQGAWMLQDYSYAKTPPMHLNKPIGMLLVTGNHYAFVMLRDSSPRTDIGIEGLKATADELRATWGPLQAQAGTFGVSGNTLTL